MRIFLFALEHGCAAPALGAVVPAAGLLCAAAHLAPIGEPAPGLLLELVLDRGLHGLEAVEVLDFDDRSLDELAVFHRQLNVDVRLKAHVPALHDSLGDAEEAADVPELAAEGDDLCAAGELRLGDDLEKGRAGAVVIGDGAVDRRCPTPTRRFVEQFARVFFEVSAENADACGFAIEIDLALVVHGGNVDAAIEADGEVVLADLVGLGKIGVEVTLAIPLGDRRDLALERKAHLDRHIDRGLVHDRQRAREREHGGVDERVGRDRFVLVRVELGAGGAWCAAEHLGARREFDVDFHADDELDPVDVRG